MEMIFTYQLEKEKRKHSKEERTYCVARKKLEYSQKLMKFRKRRINRTFIGNKTGTTRGLPRKAS